jgi:esterase/lipase
MKDERRATNGFVWGLLLGGLITLLFTTERGRKILKEATAFGLEALEKLAEEAQDLETGEEKTLKESVEKAEKMQERIESNDESEMLSQSNNGHAFKRRFFKNIKKK